MMRRALSVGLIGVGIVSPDAMFVDHMIRKTSGDFGPYNAHVFSIFFRYSFIEEELYVYLIVCIFNLYGT